MASIPTSHSDTPAAQPPPGLEPNFVDPPSRQSMIIIMEAIFTPLMVLAVSARIYVRICILKLWKAEDILPLGLGLHMWDIPLRIFQDPDNNRLLAVNLTYPWAVCFTKLSILLLYKRLFPVHRERIAVCAGIVLNVICYTTFIILSTTNIAICTNFSSEITPFCLFQHQDVPIWMSGVNVFTDFYILVLPIPCLLKLQISLKRKIGLCFTFASGLAACAASLARLVGVLQILHSEDATWISAKVSLFSISEINIGIIIACVYTFPVLLHRLRESKILESVVYYLSLQERQVTGRVGSGISDMQYSRACSN
ncbi:hypothetical protein BJX63DRAFT_420777 [Aspergillus granulosus]|uniref:Rhodopsin domain-containing protein n=1 Tax=Aspergillus granulosus TaxID=176169 RepID=A0ABR4HGG5_9EURO